VDPTRQKNLDQVFFGATVTYAHERRMERIITIGKKPYSPVNLPQTAFTTNVITIFRSITVPCCPGHDIHYFWALDPKQSS
jgi:hypothetical protein